MDQDPAGAMGNMTSAEMDVEMPDERGDEIGLANGESTSNPNGEEHAAPSDQPQQAVATNDPQERPNEEFDDNEKHEADMAALKAVIEKNKSGANPEENALAANDGDQPPEPMEEAVDKNREGAV